MSDLSVLNSCDGLFSIFTVLSSWHINLLQIHICCEYKSCFQGSLLRIAQWCKPQSLLKYIQHCLTFIFLNLLGLLQRKLANMLISHMDIC